MRSGFTTAVPHTDPDPTVPVTVNITFTLPLDEMQRYASTVANTERAWHAMGLDLEPPVQAQLELAFLDAVKTQLGERHVTLLDDKRTEELAEQGKLLFQLLGGTADEPELPFPEAIVN